MTRPRRYTASALILPTDSYAKLATVRTADTLYRDAAAALTAALDMPADAATWDPDTSTLTVTTSPVTLSDAALTDALNSIPSTPDIRHASVRIVEHAPLRDGGPRLHYLAPDRVDLFTTRLHTTPCTGIGEALIPLDDLGDVPPYLHDIPRGFTVAPQRPPVFDTAVTITAATDHAAKQLAGTFTAAASTIEQSGTQIAFTFPPLPTSQPGRNTLIDTLFPLLQSSSDTVKNWTMAVSSNITGTPELSVFIKTGGPPPVTTVTLVEGRPAVRVTDVDKLIFTGTYSTAVQTLRDALAPHLPTT